MTVTNTFAKELFNDAQAYIDDAHQGREMTAREVISFMEDVKALIRGIDSICIHENFHNEKIGYDETMTVCNKCGEEL